MAKSCAQPLGFGVIKDVVGCRSNEGVGAVQASMVIASPGKLWPSSSATAQTRKKPISKISSWMAFWRGVQENFTVDSKVTEKRYKRTGGGRLARLSGLRGLRQAVSSRYGLVGGSGN